MISAFRSMKLGILGGATVALLLACSSENTSNTAPTNGTPTDPSSNPDGGNTPADPDGGGSEPESNGKTGAVLVTQTTVSAGSTTYTSSMVSAYFADAPAGSAPSNCKTSTVDACTVNECDLTGGSSSDAGVVTPPNAGTITVRGGMLPADGWSIEPKGSAGTYTPMTSQEAVFKGGDSLRVSATGGDVPAFDNVSVHAPNDLELSQPTFDAQRRTTLDRTKDLDVAWSGASEGRVVIDVSTSQANHHSVNIHCVVDAASGQAKVPSAALAKLDAADGTTTFGTIAITPMIDTPFEAGAFHLIFRAMATANTGLFTDKK